jgi:hypothetical protein
MIKDQTAGFFPRYSVQLNTRYRIEIVQ